MGPNISNYPQISPDPRPLVQALLASRSFTPRCSQCSIVHHHDYHALSCATWCSQPSILPQKMCYIQQSSRKDDCCDDKLNPPLCMLCIFKPRGLHQWWCSRINKTLTNFGRLSPLHSQTFLHDPRKTIYTLHSSGCFCLFVILCAIESEWNVG